MSIITFMGNCRADASTDLAVELWPEDYLLSVHFEQGWSLVDQELELGLCSIAVPLYDASRRPIAALNIGAHASRTDAKTMKEHMLPPLRQAAQQISTALATGQGFCS